MRGILWRRKAETAEQRNVRLRPLRTATHRARYIPVPPPAHSDGNRPWQLFHATRLHQHARGVLAAPGADIPRQNARLQAARVSAVYAGEAIRTGRL
jgi:hypothetical protein